MKFRYWIILAGVLISFNINAQDTLINVLSDEITREMDGLKTQPIAPYYIEYRVDDIKSTIISTSFGSLVNKNEDYGRILTTTIKVGNYDLDDTHETIGTYGASGIAQPFVMKLPIENVPDALKQSVWLSTQYAYRNAVNLYNQVLSSSKDDNNKKNTPDFTKENPSTYYENPVDRTFKNYNEWVKRLKEYSEPFLSDEKVISANAILSYVVDRKYFVSSEESRIVQNSSYCQLRDYSRNKSR